MSVKVYERENDERTLTVMVEYVGRFDSFHIDFNLGSIAEKDFGTRKKGESYYYGSEHIGVVRNGLLNKFLSLFTSENSRELTKKRAIKKADKAFEKRNKAMKIEKKLEDLERERTAGV